jgi:hypothetical protein
MARTERDPPTRIHAPRAESRLTTDYPRRCAQVVSLSVSLRPPTESPMALWRWQAAGLDVWVDLRDEPFFMFTGGSQFALVGVIATGESRCGAGRRLRVPARSWASAMASTASAWLLDRGCCRATGADSRRPG